MSDEGVGGDAGGSVGGDSGASSGSGGSGATNFTGGGTDAVARDQPADKGQATAGASKPEPKPSKYKLRRGGKDVEASLEELQSWASDDWAEEIDFGGQKERMTIADMRRHASMGHGAMRKMQEAAALRKKYDAEREEWLGGPETYFSAWAQKQPPGTVPDGVSPTDVFAMKRVQEMAELEEMMSKDPRSYHLKMREREEGERRRQEKFRAEREQAQKQHQERQAAQRQLFQAIPGAMKDIGLPHNRITQGLVSRVLNEMQQAEMVPNPVQVAQYAKDYYMRDLRASLDTLDGDALESLLGDKAVKVIREAAVKRAKAAAREDQKGGTPPSKTHAPGKANGSGKGVSLNDIDFSR